MVNNASENKGNVPLLQQPLTHQEAARLVDVFAHEHSESIDASGITLGSIDSIMQRLETSGIRDEMGCREFLGVQCAILYKTKHFLQDHMDAKAVKYFDRWTYNVLEGGMTLTEMVQYRKEYISKNMSWSADVVEGAMGSITMGDVAAGMAAYGTLDEKKQFSHTGDVQPNDPQHAYISAAGNLFSQSHESHTERAQSNIINSLHTTFAGPTLARALSAYPADDDALLAYDATFQPSGDAASRDAVWLQIIADEKHGDNPRLADALLALKNNNFDFSMCTLGQQKIVLDLIRTEWNNSGDMTELLSTYTASEPPMVQQSQFNAIADRACTPGTSEVRIPLSTGEIMVLSGNKKGAQQSGLNCIKDFSRDGLPLYADITLSLIPADGSAPKILEKKSCDFSQRGGFPYFASMCAMAIYATEHADEIEAENVVSSQVLPTVQQGSDAGQTNEQIAIVSQPDIMRGKEFPRIAPRLSFDAVIANTKLDDDARVQKAREIIEYNIPKDHLFWKSLTDEKKNNISAAILRAHYSTLHKIDERTDEMIDAGNGLWSDRGSDGGIACAYFYTDEQVREKFALVMDAGLPGDIVRILMDDGIAGIAPEGLRLEIAQLRATAQEREGTLLEARAKLQDATNHGFPEIHPDNERVLGIKERNLQNDIQDIQGQLKEVIKVNRADVAAWAARTPAERALVEAEEKRLRDLQNSLQNQLDEIRNYMALLQEAKHPLKEEVANAEQELRTVRNALVNKEKEAHRFEQAPDVDPLAQTNKDGYLKEAEKRRDSHVAAAQKRVNEANAQLSTMMPPVDSADMPAYTSAKQAWEKERQDAIKAKDEAEQEYKAIVTKFREQDLKDASDAKLAKEKTAEGELKKVRGDIAGYNFNDDGEGRGLKKGSQLFLSYGDVANSQAGKLGSLWLRLEVQSVDLKTGAIEFTMHGVTDPLASESLDSLEGNSLSFGSPDEFSKFLKSGQRDESFKMPPAKKSMESWGVDLKKNIGHYNFGEKKGWVDNLLATVDFSSMTKQGPSGKGDRIAYMGKAIDGEDGSSSRSDERYKVEYVSGGVKLTMSASGGRVIKTMNYASFLIFCADKGLQALTQKEVDTINTEKGRPEGRDAIDTVTADGFHDDAVFNKNDKRGLFGWKRLTPKAMMGAGKKWTEVIKEKMKSMEKANDEEAEGVLWGSSWVKRLSQAGIPIISEALDDKIVGIPNGEDQKKLKKIDEYKGEPDKFKDSTPGGAHDIVKFTLFTASKEDATKDLLKVAGYFQWAIEKGGLYDRSLAERSDGGRGGKWIELLMGEKWKHLYHSWYNEKKTAYEKDPLNEELKNMVTYGEVYFLSKVVNEKLPPATKEVQEALGKTYSKAWMGGLLDKAVDSGMAAKEKLSSKKNELDKKEHMNFASLYKSGEFFNTIEKKGVISGLSYLEPMAKRVKGSADNLKKRSMCMLYPMLSGQLVYGANEAAIKKEYMALSRQYGFSLGLYARGQPNSRDELIKLLQIFEKESGYTGKSVTEISANTSKLGDFTLALKERWRGMGDTVMRYTQSPSDLFDLEEKLKAHAAEDSAPQGAINDAKVLSRYIDTKVNDKDAGEISRDIKTDSIALKKNIWSLSPGFANSWLWGGTTNNYSTFKSDAIENVPGIWNALTKKLEEFNAKKTMTKRDVEFILNKFFLFNQIKDPKSLLASLRQPKMDIKDKNGQVIVQQADMIKKHVTGVYDQKAPLSGDNLHPVIRNALDQWEAILARPEIKQHLSAVIDDVETLKPLARVRDNYERNAGSTAEQELLKKYSGKQANQINIAFAGASAYDGYDEDDEGYGGGYHYM